MNRRGFELAISTIIMIVIGIAVLIGLIIMIKNGFISFGEGTDPFLTTSGASVVREACMIACRAESSVTFCCEKFKVDEQDILCTDSRLKIDCPLAANCAVASCGPVT